MNKNTLPFSEKYRPRKINELVVDNIILNKINNIIQNKDVPNIIFTGKSGVGKTSTIHCIAQAIYSRHYVEESVIELNASDERGIKSVQETIINFCKKKVDYSTGYAQHKLLILDEADNITPKAQRLINLIMEKYPKTRFAFTCNDSSDIIESIQSRCVIIRFIKPPITHYLERLQFICSQENIKYNNDALLYLFDLSQKDIRQAINILELTYYTFDSITIDNINKICDVPSKIIFDNLFNAIITKNIKEISKIIDKFKNQGYYSLDVLLHFIQYIKNKNIEEDLINSNIILEKNTTTEDIKIKLIETLSNYSFIMSKSCNNYLQLTSAVYNCM